MDRSEVHRRVGALSDTADTEETLAVRELNCAFL